MVEGKLTDFKNSTSAKTEMKTLAPEKRYEENFTFLYTLLSLLVLDTLEASVHLAHFILLLSRWSKTWWLHRGQKKRDHSMRENPRVSLSYLYLRDCLRSHTQSWFHICQGELREGSYERCLSKAASANQKFLYLIYFFITINIKISQMFMLLHCLTVLNAR